MTFDPRLRCKTRGGYAAEIVAILPPDKVTTYRESIVALVTDNEGRREIQLYRADGSFGLNRKSPCDLVNVPVPVVTAEQYAALVAGETANRKQFVTRTAAQIRAVVEG